MVVCLFTASIGTANGLSKGDAWNTIIRAVRFYSRTGEAEGERVGYYTSARSMHASHSSSSFFFFFNPSLLQIFACNPSAESFADRKSIFEDRRRCLRPSPGIFLYLSRGTFPQGNEYWRGALKKYTWFREIDQLYTFRSTSLSDRKILAFDFYSPKYTDTLGFT